MCAAVLVATALCVGGVVATTTTSAAAAPALGALLAGAKPTAPAEDDAKPVELGVRFRAVSAVTLTGIQFYKDADNTGPHTATLWSTSGALLASATFKAESGSGWQSALFDKPVPTTVGTTYVASYHTNTGSYVEKDGAFSKGATIGQGPLIGTAGVYRYGSGGFPSETWNAAHYFVDVLTGGTQSPSTAPATTSSAPRPTASSPSTSASSASSRPTSSTPTTSSPTTGSTTPKPTTPKPTSAAPKPTTSAPTAPTAPTAPSTAFPGAGDTGYRNAPGYPGALTNCALPIISNTTYRFCNFPDGASVGTAAKPVSGVTFLGSRFASNAVTDANVAVYGSDITFDYTSFEPSATSTRPVAYAKGYQYGLDIRRAGAVTVDHADFWGWGNGIQFGNSSQSAPLIVRNSWFHDARDDNNGVDHTDAILSNEGGPTYMVFDHNTIASEGNTQGLALQTESRGYDHVTITNNYFSGFGYTVAIGETIPCTNITFTGNVIGTDFKPVWGILYSSTNWGSSGNTWRGNTWNVVNANDSRAANDGKFWLPSGDASSTDFSG
jgi:hypothetical protein